MDSNNPESPLIQTTSAMRENPAEWNSGARRSAPQPEWSMMPWNALREVLRRFDVGKKYGRHNWKKAQFSDDLDYVRQFDAHMIEHYRAFLALIDRPKGATSPKGDDLVSNLAALAWNAIALLDYLLENEQLVRRALSQYPQGHPKGWTGVQPPVPVADSPVRTTTALDSAETFLRDILATGPLGKTEILKAATVEGIAEKTLNRAKKALGIRSIKASGRFNGDWFWFLPEQLAPQTPQTFDTVPTERIRQ